MNIGQAAALSGVSTKMVRHYESLGLLPTVTRTQAGYRQYGAAEVHTLRFIRRGRELGFAMAEVAELLKLWQNRRRASADVKRIALSHVADLDRRIAEMMDMRRTLEALVQGCQGNERPDCPILDDLAEPDRPLARCHGPRGGPGTSVQTGTPAAAEPGRRASTKRPQSP